MAMSLSVIKDSKNVEDVLAAEIAAFRRSLSSVSTAASGSGSETQEADHPGEFLKWRDVYNGDITEHHLQEIKNELGLIEMCWDKLDYSQSSSNYPESYSSNSEKEKLLLWVVNNFRRQFHSKFPRRRPLLLACNNECGVQKMVSTSIRPTSIRFPDLQSHLTCASFVSDYVQYVPLINVSGLPDQLVSPGEVLARQNGHCFEMANLLASLLIGATYRAFVVSGYATREICINDTSRTECQYLVTNKSIESTSNISTPSKYELKPPRDLGSQFLIAQEEKEKARETAAKEAQARAELQALMEFESPPHDSYWKHRRHAWVLVLPSKDLTEPCFLEPASGIKKSINDPEYHGIDSIWNHINYWVAVGQNRIVPCENISYDLNDGKYWQSVLPGEVKTEKKTQIIDEVDMSLEKHLDMPASWTSKIILTHSDYERRYVDCHKTVQYRKCVVDLLAPYSDTSGLVTRVTYYTDYDCTNVQDVREAYKNRSDLLYLILEEGDTHHHRFRRGRQDAVTEHRFKAPHRGLANDLELEFNPKSRSDNLFKLIKKTHFLYEEFKSREDYLQSRHTLFGDNGTSILKMTEKYNRNLSKPYSDDAASIEYQEEKVLIVYHYGEEQITAARREMCLTTMKQIAFYDPVAQICPLRPLELHTFLQSCARNKIQAEINVRKREEEITKILINRAREMAEPKLNISLFDEDRNQDARDRYKLRDRKINEEIERNLSLEVDLLAPYLAALSEEELMKMPLLAEHARNIYTKCLQDWKTMLLARAVDIERQFEQLCEDLKRCAGDKRSASDRVDERYFQLHCLKVRLMRHKELAPRRYLAIDACLRSDSRISNAFHSSDSIQITMPFVEIKGNPD